MTPDQLLQVAHANTRKLADKVEGQAKELTNASPAAKYGGVAGSVGECLDLLRQVERRLGALQETSEEQ